MLVTLRTRSGLGPHCIRYSIDMRKLSPYLEELNPEKEEGGRTDKGRGKELQQISEEILGTMAHMLVACSYFYTFIFVHTCSLLSDCALTRYTAGVCAPNALESETFATSTTRCGMCPLPSCTPSQGHKKG